MEQPTWGSCLALALTGAVTALPKVGSPGAVLAALAELGWDRAAIAGHARAVTAAGRPWPHPAPEASARFGPARWQAALDESRRLLGLETVVRPPSRRSTLTADERRLLAERPPHHDR
ncbi:MAG: hypothetical protein LBK42_12025 [Propionibacteriaceae bacterium]|jgi:hypothetical protein|nr:hypothetical protein [Propionibacteriaceae bacterium]